MKSKLEIICLYFITIFGILCNVFYIWFNLQINNIDMIHFVISGVLITVFSAILFCVSISLIMQKIRGKIK